MSRSNLKVEPLTDGVMMDEYKVSRGAGGIDLEAGIFQVRASSSVNTK